ncbi:MAG: hypothetical protein JXA99_13640 [Candidatus Lokiarchaeota archaeon]|nr:hypothetical protein [Candidatus Lokiarchaeota archaeon]
MHLVKPVIKIILILFVILIVIFSILFLKNDKLNPSIKEIEKRNSKKYTHESSNIFYHLVAFGCDKKFDPFEVGVKYVELQRNKVKSFKEINDLNLNSYEIQEITNLWIDVFETNSSTSLIKNQKSIKRLIKEHPTLEIRFNETINIKKFYTPYNQHFTNQTPILINYVNYYRLRLLSNLVLYFNGRKNESLMNIKNDLNFIRNLLADCDLLIVKLISVTLFELTLDTFDFIINNENQLFDIEEHILKINPLTKEEYSLKEVLLNEYLFFNSKYDIPLNDFRKFKFKMILSYLNIILNSKDEDKNLKDLEMLTSNYPKVLKIKAVDYFQLLTLTPNKLKNQLYLNQKQYLELSDYPTIKLNNGFHLIEGNKTKKDTMNLLEFLSQGAFMYKQNITMIRELDGSINLLKSKYLIKREKVDQERIEEFLKVHKDSLNNPFTGESLNFDDENSTLYYKSLFDYNFTDLRILKL